MRFSLRPSLVAVLVIGAFSFLFSPSIAAAQEAYAPVTTEQQPSTIAPETTYPTSPEVRGNEPQEQPFVVRRSGPASTEELERINAMYEPETTPWYTIAWSYGWRAMLLWLAAWTLLFLAGTSLSRATLSASQSNETTARERSLQRLYRVVLSLSCAMHYVSIPMIGLLVITPLAAVLFSLVMVGRLPLGAMLAFGTMTYFTLGAMLKSFSHEAKPSESLRNVSENEQPALWQIARDVAKEADTRPVDRIMLAPFCELEIFEEGGIVSQLRGDGERCLIVGVGLLHGLTVAELRSILAHEYGHFLEHDAAVGRLSLAVRRSAGSLIRQLEESNAELWYNPAWIYAKLFLAFILRVSQGASRLQELLADRVAARAYGSALYARALHRTMECSLRLSLTYKGAVREGFAQNAPLRNLYAHTLIEPVNAQLFAEALGRALRFVASAYESHPIAAERIERVNALALPYRSDASDERRAIELLSDRESIELTMTASLRAQIERTTARVIPSEPSAAPQ